MSDMLIGGDIYEALENILARLIKPSTSVSAEYPTTEETVKEFITICISLTKEEMDEDGHCNLDFVKAWAGLVENGVVHMAQRKMERYIKLPDRIILEATPEKIVLTELDEDCNKTSTKVLWRREWRVQEQVSVFFKVILPQKLKEYGYEQYSLEIENLAMSGFNMEFQFNDAKCVYIGTFPQRNSYDFNKLLYLIGSDAKPHIDDLFTYKIEPHLITLSQSNESVMLNEIVWRKYSDYEITKNINRAVDWWNEYIYTDNDDKVELKTRFLEELKTTLTLALIVRKETYVTLFTEYWPTRTLAAIYIAAKQKCRNPQINICLPDKFKMNICEDDVYVNNKPLRDK